MGGGWGVEWGWGCSWTAVCASVSLGSRPVPRVAIVTSLGAGKQHTDMVEHRSVLLFKDQNISSEKNGQISDLFVPCVKSSHLTSFFS